LIFRAQRILPFFQKALNPEHPKPSNVFKQNIHALIITCFVLFRQELNDKA